MLQTDPVPRGLNVSAAYAWRILVLCACAFVLLTVLTQIALVVIALFVALIITALVSPTVRILGKIMPSLAAALLGLVVLLVVIAGILAFITGSVAGEWDTLALQVGDGVRQTQSWLHDGPFHISANDFTTWYDNGRMWATEHRGELVQGAVGGASTALEILGAIALALFSAVCFLQGGRTIWNWVVGLFPKTQRARIDGAGHVAWRSFAGYTRGIMIIAATNAAMVLVLLLILRVPLAVPLALVVFFGTFIPLIGAPLAMLLSVFVALAARGPITALVVLAGIFLLGQIEGHLLQPLVMSKAVNIHAFAVAVAVASGTLLAGLFGAVVAVPVVSVIYGVAKFWVQTAPPPTPPGGHDEVLWTPDPT
ncbi:MAG: AI-2E family transporter [Actinomycetes bacterium]